MYVAGDDILAIEVAILGIQAEDGETDAEA